MDKQKEFNEYWHAKTTKKHWIMLKYNTFHRAHVKYSQYDYASSLCQIALMHLKEILYTHKHSVQHIKTKMQWSDIKRTKITKLALDFCRSGILVDRLGVINYMTPAENDDLINYVLLLFYSAWLRNNFSFRSSSLDGNRGEVKYTRKWQQAINVLLAKGYYIEVIKLNINGDVVYNILTIPPTMKPPTNLESVLMDPKNDEKRHRWHRYLNFCYKHDFSLRRDFTLRKYNQESIKILEVIKPQLITPWKQSVTRSLWRSL